MDNSLPTEPRSMNHKATTSPREYLGILDEIKLMKEGLSNKTITSESRKSKLNHFTMQTCRVLTKSN
jgi:hypothetical protein